MKANNMQHETSHEYAQRRANETGRPYMVIVPNDEPGADGNALMDCAQNRKAFHDELKSGFIAVTYTKE